MTSGIEEGHIPVEGRNDKGKGMGRRLLLRVRTALKRGEPSRRQSTQLDSHIATTHRPADASSTPAAVALTASDDERPTSQPEDSQQDGNLPQVDSSLPVFEGERIPRAQVYGERFEHFSDCYGLELSPDHQYSMDGHVLRVHKPLRMRIHRQCHQCHSELNSTGVCEKCNHSFCRQCTRYPPKRSEAEKAASRDQKAAILKERSANAMIPPDWDSDPDTKVVLRIPPKPSVQQELVYKKVRQRVRRMCCQCQEADGSGSGTLFQGGKRNCSKCGHLRCTDCPRDPPKKEKYPYGYPGDQFGAKSIPHHRCHECYTTFPPGAENGTACSACSHVKCANCERLRPQKVEPKPDPEVMRSVREKLGTLQLA